MYQKYFVYIDDGYNVYKIAVAAVSEDAARAFCAGNGEIVAIKDVTEEYQIGVDKVQQALQKDGGFDMFEIDFIVRALREFGIVE